MYFFVAKLLSIAVITYTYIRQSRPTPASNEPADLLRTQWINFSYAMRMWQLHVCWQAIPLLF